jgi:hypothetical protein
LKIKWDKLALYQQTTDLKTLEQEKVFQFLSDLDASYEPIKAQILFFKELSKIRIVVATVQREESRRAFMNPQPPSSNDNQAFSVYNKTLIFRESIGEPQQSAVTTAKRKGTLEMSVGSSTLSSTRRRKRNGETSVAKTSGPIRRRWGCRLNSRRQIKKMKGPYLALA